MINVIRLCKSNFKHIQKLGDFQICKDYMSKDNSFVLIYNLGKEDCEAFKFKLNDILCISKDAVDVYYGLFGYDTILFKIKRILIKYGFLKHKKLGAYNIDKLNTFLKDNGKTTQYKKGKFDFTMIIVDNINNVSYLSI